MKLKTSIITKSVCILLMAGFLTGCGKPLPDVIIDVESGNDEINYELINVTRGDVISTKQLRCTYTQTDAQQVHFAVSGKLVDKVYVQEGDSVKKGDVLAELSSGNLEQEIENLTYRIARNKLLLEYCNTNEELAIQDKWVSYEYYSGRSQWDWDATEAAIEELQKNTQYQREDYEDALEFDQKKLNQLTKELKESRVYAEQDGVVYQMKKNLQGSTSNVDKVIMTIADNSEGLFEVEAGDFAKYFHEGETVKMNISVGNAKGDYELMPANLELWGEKQYFSVFTGPDSASIEVGNGGTITLTTDQRMDVLTLPNGTVHDADGEFYVYVLDENGMRQVCWVTVGLQGDTNVEILDGLAEGDKVIKR